MVTMRASPRMLVLLLVALHLQCLYTKYYLVKTDGKAASVHKKHIGSPKHVLSKTKTGKARRRKKAPLHPSTSSGTRKSTKSKNYNQGKHPNPNSAEFGFDYNDNYISPNPDFLGKKYYPGNHGIPGNTGSHVHPGSHGILGNQVTPPNTNPSSPSN